MLEIPFELLKPEIKNFPINMLADCLNRLVSSSSYQRGLVAEKSIAESIVNFEVDVEKKPHCGDMRIWKSGSSKSIMIEVKNYTAKVPHSQWEKFIADKEMYGYEAALLVTNQPVCGVKSPIYFAKNICCVVSHDADIINMICEILWSQIQDSPNNDLELNLEILNHVLETLFELRCAAERMEKSLTKELRCIYKKIDVAKLSLKSLTEKISKAITELKFSTGFGSRVEVAEKLWPVINQLSPVQIIVAGNLTTAIFAEKNIEMTNLKTKLKISFIPKHFDFTDLSVNFINGKIELEITEKNYLSDIYQIILKLF